MLLEFHHQLILEYEQPKRCAGRPSPGKSLGHVANNKPFQFYLELQMVQLMMLRRQLQLRLLENLRRSNYFPPLKTKQTIFKWRAILTKSVVFIYKPNHTNHATVN